MPVGTSKSYSGTGGKAGKDLREGMEEWLENLPATPQESPSSEESRPTSPDAELPLDVPFQSVIGLLRPRGGGGGDGPGGGGGGGSRPSGGGRSSGGPKRTAARSATTAGRAAAAAYAFRVGDIPALTALGLDYNELASLGSPILVTRKIVEMVCGPRGDSTIDDTEQRLIAAEVAEWVVNQDSGGYTATPEDIAKHAVANIVIDTLLTEAGALIGNSDKAAVAENEIRAAAENWVENHADITIDGATEADFSRAIELGIESLRKIIRGDS